jgi:hypothetical protein
LEGGLKIPIGSQNTLKKHKKTIIGKKVVFQKSAQAKKNLRQILEYILSKYKNYSFSLSAEILVPLICMWKIDLFNISSLW